MLQQKLILIQKIEQKNGSMLDSGCHSNETKHGAFAHTRSLTELCVIQAKEADQKHQKWRKFSKKSCYCRLTCLNHLNHDKYHDKTLTPAMCNKGTSERPGVQQNTKKTPPKKSIKDKMSTFMDYHLYTFSEVFFHIGLLRYTKT